MQTIEVLSQVAPFVFVGAFLVLVIVILAGSSHEEKDKKRVRAEKKRLAEKGEVPHLEVGPAQKRPIIKPIRRQPYVPHPDDADDDDVYWQD